ncbi:MAG: carboxylating nicotinate-nucleotide diphosphorylase [Candidatus Omnitrophica bacterium]|nr:carboxylating nicotinate-nucleotide diphosphorylase [Candidatus Omnitrophota bacterium]
MTTIEIDKVVRIALKEDLGSGDVTTASLIAPSIKTAAVIVMREPAVVCGVDFIKRTFLQLDNTLKITFAVKDGDIVEAGTAIASVCGNARGVLSGERVALNFLGRLSGIATVTRYFVDAVRGTRAVIMDTRKTAAGLRLLDRYAVGVGGGVNHRFDLGEMVLVKDNHRMLCGGHGSLANVVKVLRAKTAKLIEFEVDTLPELEDVLGNPPDIILLDNMPVEKLRKAVKMVGRLPVKLRPLLEASGGITINNVREVALTGVDRISIGALTHSVRCVDVSLDLS